MSSAILLVNSAECLINAMHLRTDDQGAVRKCISKYSMPDNCSEIIYWVIYRIENAVKHVFGVSDWQISQQIIHHRAMEMAEERGLVQSNPSTRIEQQIKKNIIDLTQTAAEGLLANCFLAQDLRANLNDELRSTAGQLDLNHVIEEIRMTRDRIYRRIPTSQLAT